MTLTADPQEPASFVVDVDPVCGCQLLPEVAAVAPRVEWEGATFVFCSETCRARFLVEPERYLDTDDDG